MNLGKQILELVGGESNVSSVAHCATRLRFRLKDESKAKQSEIENLDGVISVVRKGGQFQIVIGTHVANIHKQVIEGTNFSQEGSSSTAGDEKKNLLASFMETVSGLFTPLLPLLAGSGLLRGTVLLCTQMGLLSETDSTYTILTAASMAVFYFLPILLAFTAADRFGCSRYIAVAIMGALIMPDFMDMMGEEGNGAMVSFVGLPIVMMKYPYTVIPAILSIYLYSRLEGRLNHWIPATVQLCFVPLISLLVMVPLTAGVVGPLGVYLGNGISYVVNTLIELNGWIAGAVVGGCWNILVIFGIHWAVNPVMIQNVSVNGFDYIVPFTAATNFGMAGATFGVFLKTKNIKMKQFSMSALLSIFFAGITEPAIYGVGVKYRKPLVAAFIGGALGGAFMGGMGVKAYAFVFGGLTTIPAFAGPTLMYYVIGLAICFGVSTAVMMFLGINDDVPEVKPAMAEDNGNRVAIAGEEMALPISGTVNPLSACSDETFASGAMGKGVVIIPSEGRIYAPFDGKVIMVTDSLHAIALRSVKGIEVLIHVGIDTVEMAGKPFKVFVRAEQTVKKGTLLMEFDMDMIRQAGKSIEVPVILTNAADNQVVYDGNGNLTHGDILLTVS